MRREEQEGGMRGIRVTIHCREVPSSEERVSRVESPSTASPPPPKNPNKRNKSKPSSPTLTTRVKRVLVAGTSGRKNVEEENLVRSLRLRGLRRSGNNRILGECIGVVFGGAKTFFCSF